MLPTEIVGANTESFQLHRPPPVAVTGNPVDLAVADTDAGRLLAVATNPYTLPYHPSNIRLYDVTDDQQWHWVGAVTIGKDPIEGMIKRLVLRDGRLYVLASGQGKGVHVIDIPTARALFEEKTGGEEGVGFYDLLQSLGIEGRGFGETTVVQSVHIPTGTGLNSQMQDMAIADFTVDGIAQPIAVATGRSPLAIVNPQTGQVLYNGPILNDAGESVTSWGTAIEAGNVNGTPIALVAAVPAVNATGSVLVVVDLTELSNPRAIGTLTLSGNAFSVSDILLQGTTAYVGTDAGTYVVSLAELTQPRLVSMMTNVGGRLGLVDANLLFGTMRSAAVRQHALGGVRSAAIGPVLLIEKVVPVLVPTNSEGATTEPITVTYRAIAPPEDPPLASVTVRRDDARLLTLPLPTIIEGRHEVILPAGLRFDPPSDRLEVSLVHADGSVSAPVVKVIESPGDTATQGLTPVPPNFTSLIPTFVMQGSIDTTVRITGQGLAGLTQVFVRGADGEWTGLKPASRNDTAVTVRLPAGLLGTAGFLQVAPSDQEADALAFLVADPAQPALATATAITVSGVDQTEIGSAGRIRVFGQGFVPGVSVLLGRNGRIALPTEFVSETEVIADLPGIYLGLANDLYLAVASDDGVTASASVPVQSSTPSSAVDYGTIVSAPTTVSSIYGTLTWNQGDQDLVVEGYGLEPGVEFTVTGPGKRVVKKIVGAPWGGPRASDRQLGRIRVTVLAADLRWPSTCVQLLSDDERRLPASDPHCVGQSPMIAIPLGGRVRLSAYTSAKDSERIYIVPQADPQARVVECTPPKRNPVPVRARVSGIRLLPPAEVSFAFTGAIPAVPHPFKSDLVDIPDIPLVEREVNPCDPDDAAVPYLRGVRLSTAADSLSVRAQTSVAGTIKSATLGVTVTVPELGPQGGPENIDGVLIAVGSETGIPPQLLKGQIEKETGFVKTKYRYEPVTVDFKNISGVARVRDTKFETYARRHLYGGNLIESADGGDAGCVAFLGPGAQAPQGCTAVDGAELHVRPVQFADPAQLWIGARSGMPRTDAAYRAAPTVTATRRTSAGGTESLTVVNAPLWHHASVNGSQSEFVTTYPAEGQLQIDYAMNRAVINPGRRLVAGERLEVRYNRVGVTEVAHGTCVVPPQTFNKKDEKGRLTFAVGDTIATWFMRNGRDGFNYLVTGAQSEGYLEFSRNFDRTADKPKWVPPRTGMIDGRFRAATAEYVAAGSFGLLQATLNLWLESDDKKVSVLNQAFDLTREENCLPALIDDVRSALRVAAASHSFSFRERTAAQEDQLAWAQRWTRIIRSYNPSASAKKYVPGKSEVSSIVRSGVETYGAK